MNLFSQYSTLLLRRHAARLAATGVLAFMANAFAALAHDSTLHASEKARDRREVWFIAAGSPLAALAEPLPAGTPVCQLTIKLVDEKTRRPIPGLVRVKGADGNAVPLAGLLQRAIGL